MYPERVELRWTTKVELVPKTEPLFSKITCKNRGLHCIQNMNF